jgi:AcrR family transcriptional regulator
MKSDGVLTSKADAKRLALAVVAGHQGAGMLAFTYRQEWPLADSLRYVVNHLRLFATDPAERVARRPRRPRDRRPPEPVADDAAERFTRKGLATRSRILDGAAHLMFEHGVSSISLNHVRSTVGVSGSQLSHYFTDKRELTRRVIGVRINEVIEFHTQPKLGALDSWQALRAWADACIAQVPTVYLVGGCIYGSLTGELLEADSDVLDELAAGYERWLKVFHDGLAAMRRRGDLTEDADPRHLAVALLAAHQGGTLLTYATGSAEPFGVSVNAALDYVGSFRPAAKTRKTASRPKNKR